MCEKGHLEGYSGKSSLVGGLYEQLVRSVKRSIKSMGRSNITCDQLGTLLVEIKGIISLTLVHQLTWQMIRMGLVAAYVSHISLLEKG